MSARIKLHNVDCMDYMRGLPDKAFELAIVDPPYGIMDLCKTGGGLEDKPNNRKKKFNRGVKGKPHSVIEMRKWDIQPPAEYFDELRRVTKNQIIWGANFLTNLNALSRGWICWDKQVPDTMKISQFEVAFTSFNQISRTFHYSWGNERGFAPKSTVIDKPFANIHPCQKPVKLYEWLLMNYANEGDRILDTHLGSGSSAIAAHNLGFEFVGCELDTDYFNAAQKWLKQHQSQLRIPV